jgi:hypothetical protein
MPLAGPLPEINPESGSCRPSSRGADHRFLWSAWLRSSQVPAQQCSPQGDRRNRWKSLRTNDNPGEAALPSTVFSLISVTNHWFREFNPHMIGPQSVHSLVRLTPRDRQSWMLVVPFSRRWVVAQAMGSALNRCRCPKWYVRSCWARLIPGWAVDVSGKELAPSADMRDGGKDLGRRGAPLPRG